MKRIFWPLLLILLIFAFVVAKLNEDSFWMDEGFSAWLVRDIQAMPDSPREILRYVRDSFSTTFERLRTDVHPPLYYLLLDAWTLLVGQSEFALRLPSALLGIISLATTYQFGVRAFNRRAAWMALLLLGTSGFFIYYSREARSYSLYLALASLTTLAYWHFWKNPKFLRGIFYAGMATALLYTHYSSFTLITVYGLHSLLSFRKWRDLSRFWPLLLTGLFFAPWWFSFGLEQFRINTNIEAAGALPSDWGTIAALLLVLTSGIWGFFALSFVLSRFILKLNYAVLFCLFLGIVPIILLFGANALGLSIFQLRYLIIIVPAWALLVAYALSEFWLPFLRDTRIRTIAAIGLLLWISYSQIANFREFWPSKSNWREAVQLANEERQPLEPALVYLDEKSPFAYYSYQFGLLEGISINIAWREFAPQEIFDIANALENQTRVWAFVAMQAPESWDTVAVLSANRGVTYRDEVQWTIFYRFDEASEENLSFSFGDLLAYRSPFYRRFEAKVGEEFCLSVELKALADLPEDYSIGVHLTRGYNEVLAQVDEALGALASGDIIKREFCLTPPETDTFHLRLVIYDWRNPLNRLPVLENGLLWGDYLMLGVLESE